MSQELKRDWIPKLQARYAGRGREGRSRMLDELCQDYEYERKYAIKLLGGSLPEPSGKVRAGREPQYGLIEPVVQAIWLWRPSNPAASGWCPFSGSGCPSTNGGTGG